MKNAAIALLLWCSCAPLTSPEGGVPGEWQEVAEEAVAPPSALEAYMAARLRYGDGPRPDFVAVVPFADESGFRQGVWDVEYEMANMLSIELAAIPEWQVVPFNAVAELTMAADGRDGWSPLEVGRHLQADMVVLGLLQDYDMRRLSVGDPLLGGYQSYVAVAQMQAEVVRVADGGESGSPKLCARSLNAIWGSIYWANRARWTRSSPVSRTLSLVPTLSARPCWVVRR